jgi:tRNA(Ile)-lysidine synthase
LPALDQALPERSVVEGILQSHAELRAVDAWTEARATALLDRALDEKRLPASLLRSAPAFVQKRLLQKYIRRATGGLEVSDETLEVLLSSDEERRQRQLSADFNINWTDHAYDIVSVTKVAFQQGDENREHSLRVPGSICLANGMEIRATQEELTSEQYRRILSGEISPEKEVWMTTVNSPLKVRSWQPGDRYRPLGAPGRRKLQDCFVDLGIEQNERHCLPIVCDSDDKILWVPGLPPSHLHRLTVNTRWALRLTYQQS